MAHEAGKGDKRRPEDNVSYENNHEKIFGVKKSVRGSFIWDEKKGAMVSKDEYYAQSEKHETHMVIGDIHPYKSMVTGEMITSRSHHRSHLKQHGMIEVGNEVKHMMNQPKKDDSAKLREQIARQVYQKLRY